MKKLILLMMLPFIMEGQNDSLCIIKEHNDMKDKTYFYFDKVMVYYDSIAKVGFKLHLGMNDKMEVTDITSKMFKYEGCNEKDELIIMFSDSSKLKLISFASFNCDGDSYFKVSKKDIEKLRAIKVLKVMLTNGRSYESHTIRPKKPDYFIRAFDAIDKKIIKVKNS